MYVIILLIISIFVIFIWKLSNLYRKHNVIKNISVIILSYNRPHNLKKSLPILETFKNIGEIIVLHGTPENFVTHKKYFKVKDVQDFENNKKYYTLRRFLYAEKCKFDTILFLDDDIVPSEKLIKDMIEKNKTHSYSCVGPITRMCNKNGYYTISAKKNIILTPILLCSKKVVCKVWEQMKKNTKMFDTVIDNKGNGEDLLFQHEYKKFYQKSPIPVHGKYNLLDIGNGFSTTNITKHYKIRNKFCRDLNK